jgi:FkbM family methyltransferase
VRKLLEASGLNFGNDVLTLPEGRTRLKIDIGLSVNAPQSQIWLENDDELFVIGVEPLSSNIESIAKRDTHWPISLDPTFLKKRMFIVHTALSDIRAEEGLTFYVTENDPGCSSLLKPKNFSILRTETVPVWTLRDLIGHIPADLVPVIDHVKIDTQGSDLKILMGCGEELNRIFAITVEIDSQEYEGTNNSISVVKEYLKAYGFQYVKPGIYSNLKFLLKGYMIDVEADDATFINSNWKHLARHRRFFLYQRG